MSNHPKTCAAPCCDNQLEARNRSGLCRACYKSPKGSGHSPKPRPPRTTEAKAMPGVLFADDKGGPSSHALRGRLQYRLRALGLA